ncbi:MAG TPA: sugar ABC transporter permease [Devosiaceae bacterium]|nr:sugar ABC transporter permease [Devosiaceae bacterium]
MTVSNVTKAPPKAGRSRARLWWEAGEGLPYILLLPSLVVIGLVIFYPFVTGFWYSLTDGSLMRPGNFVGLDNYFQLFTMRDFQNSLWFSFVFAVANVVGCYLLGLGLALLMNMEMPGRAFFRVALLLPWIIPSVVSIVAWRWMVADQHAFFNQIIRFFGFDAVFFLANEVWAQVIVVLIKIWRSFPFMMLSLLAALQGIDRTLYEAAALDGASKWEMFWHITLPQLRDISIVLCLLMTIWTVNDFDTPWLLTQGGPANATENLVVLAHKYTFARNDLGLGSAISFVTLLILLVFIIFMLRKQKNPQG